MEWISDVSVGAWLRERLDDDFKNMHGVVPRGHEAYARVFHPASVRSLPDQAMPEPERWWHMAPDETARLSALITDAPTTWAATAEAFGTTMHALAQWPRLVRTPPETDWNTRVSPDGRAFDAPDDGSLDPEQLGRLATHLAAHTTTPDDCVIGLWPGHGRLIGFLGQAPSPAFGQVGDPGSAELAHHNEMLGRSFKDRFNNVFRRPTWQEGILSREISEGPQLKLTDREYLLFGSGIDAFANPDWILDAPWRDRPLEARGFPARAEAPNLIWPADHAWVMVSEIDFDSTIVAGSADLVRAICADEHLEALPIPEGAVLGWDSDPVNR